MSPLAEQKQYKCKCSRSFSLYTDLINHKCEIDCFLDDLAQPPLEPIHAPQQAGSVLADKCSLLVSKSET